MARYDVYTNPNGVGYLLDLQSDLLAGIESRVVAPLIPVSAGLRTADRLNPVFKLDGRDHMLVTQSLAAIPARILNKPTTNLSAQFDKITNAVDMVFHGF